MYKARVHFKKTFNLGCANSSLISNLVSLVTMAKAAQVSTCDTRRWRYNWGVKLWTTVLAADPVKRFMVVWLVTSLT